MNKLLFMLSAISFLIILSCKKESETKTPCSMATATSRPVNGDIRSIKNYTADKKGRITTIRIDDSEINYTYSIDQIIEEESRKDGYKAIYQLDASGKIVSAAVWRNGFNDVSNVKYTYNADGYLSEVNDNYGTSTIVQKYNYTNGNLTSIITTDSHSQNVKNLMITYNDELTPNSFFHYYGMPNVEILKAYFGKTSKNLISGMKQKDSDTSDSYTYQKNAEGNIRQMTLTSNITTFIYDYTYTCN